MTSTLLRGVARVWCVCATIGQHLTRYMYMHVRVHVVNGGQLGEKLGWSLRMLFHPSGAFYSQSGITIKGDRFRWLCVPNILDALEARVVLLSQRLPSSLLYTDGVLISSLDIRLSLVDFCIHQIG